MAVNTVDDFLMESHSFSVQHHSHLILLTFVAFFLFILCCPHYPWMISSLLHHFSFHMWMTSEYSQPSISVGSASGNLTNLGWKIFGKKVPGRKTWICLELTTIYRCALFYFAPLFVLHITAFFTNLGLWQPWIEQVCWCHFFRQHLFISCLCIRFW